MIGKTISASDKDGKEVKGEVTAASVIGRRRDGPRRRDAHRARPRDRGRRG